MEKFIHEENLALFKKLSLNRALTRSEKCS